MTQLENEQITANDQDLFAIGNLLISRYIQIAEYRSEQNHHPVDCPGLLEKLEFLLSAFLDRSSKWSVTLLNFHEKPPLSYIIEFNGNAQAGIRIENSIASFFGCKPSSYSCKRHLGAATDCLQLTLKDDTRKPQSGHCSELGLAPRTQ